MRVKKLTALLLAGALTVSTLTGCGINKSATVATMTGTKVTLGVANFMCMYQQAKSDEVYRSYYGDDAWNSDLFGIGSTMIENTKTGVMDSLHDMYTLKAHMSDYEVELTDEEKTSIQQSAAAFIAANGRSTLSELGADQGIVEEVLTLYTIQSKMHDAIVDKVEVTDEEANMRAYTIVRIDYSGVDDTDDEELYDTEEEDIEDEDIEDSEEDVGDEDIEDSEKEELLKTAEAIAEAAKAGEDLDSVASDNGQTAETGTYDADDEELEEEIKDALDELKEGEVSDVITTDTEFVVVKLDKETDEEATEENRESIIDEKYHDQLEEWQEDDGWTVKQKQLDKIKFRNKFQTTDNSTPETEAADTAATEADTAAAADTAATEADTTAATDTEAPTTEEGKDSEAVSTEGTGTEAESTTEDGAAE